MNETMIDTDLYREIRFYEERQRLNCFYNYYHAELQRLGDKITNKERQIIADGIFDVLLKLDELHDKYEQ